MTSRSPKGTYLRVWTSSYARRLLFTVTALLSAIVIVAAGAFYAVMRNEIARMAGDRSRQELERTAASFSTMFASSIIPASEQVFETPEVNNLIYGSTLTDQQLVTATPLVDRFQLANPLIDSISVYNSQRRTIYSTRYGLSKASDPRNSDIMAIIGQIDSYRLYRFIPRIEAGKQLLTVILGTKPYTGHTLLGGLIVNVSENAIGTQLLGRRTDDGSRFVVLDSSGVVLFDTASGTFGSSAKTVSFLARAFGGARNSGSFPTTATTTPSLVSYYREPLVGWTFVSTTPNSVLFAEISRWRNEVVLVFAALLLLSVGLALSTLRGVSVPLSRLFAQARELQGDLTLLGPSQSDHDDLSLISETMELLRQRLHGLLHENGVEGRGLARTFGRALLDQELSEAETSRLHDELFDTESGELIVLLLAIDDLEARQASLGRTSVLSIRGDLVARLLKQVAVRTAVEMETGTVAAAVVCDVAGDANDALNELWLQVRSRDTANGVSITAGASDPVDNFDDLAAAYDAASEAVRYRFRYGKGSLILQAQCRRAGQSYSVPEADLRRLSEQARLRNRAAVVETISRILHDVRRFAHEDFVFLSQNILHTLERVFADSGVMTRRELDEYRGYMLSARWIETTDDVRDLATEWSDRFFERADEQSDQRVPSFVADAKRIVEREIVNPNLSAKSVAATLKTSVNYVRATFKSATGESLSNFITRLRLDRCKQMLESTDMPVKDIAQAAGFGNYNYFFTLFKKQTGRTPQEYQRQIAIK